MRDNSKQIEMIKDGLYLDISSYATYYTNRTDIKKSGYYPFTQYSLTWKALDCENDKNDDYEAVAKMELWCAQFIEAEDGFEPLDECSQETLDVFDCAYRHAQKMKVEAWLPIDKQKHHWEPAQFVYIKHFYISPKYRGLGLSVQLLMSLTKILPDIGYSSDDAIIATLPNPFEKQKQLKLYGALGDGCFGGYMEKDNNRRKKMLDIMIKPLQTCGFTKYNDGADNIYIATYKDLRSKAIDSGFCDENDGYDPIMEYDYSL